MPSVSGSLNLSVLLFVLFLSVLRGLPVLPPLQQISCVSRLFQPFCVLELFQSTHHCNQIKRNKDLLVPSASSGTEKPPQCSVVLSFRRCVGSRAAGGMPPGPETHCSRHTNPFILLYDWCLLDSLEISSPGASGTWWQDAGFGHRWDSAEGKQPEKHTRIENI